MATLPPRRFLRDGSKSNRVNVRHPLELHEDESSKCDKELTVCMKENLNIKNKNAELQAENNAIRHMAELLIKEDESHSRVRTVSPDTSLSESMSRSRSKSPLGKSGGTKSQKRPKNTRRYKIVKVKRGKSRKVRFSGN